MKHDNGLEYFCDKRRHVVCKPYSVANLHIMADDLKIKRGWFDSGLRPRWPYSKWHPHYDMPKKRIAEITAKCTLISSRDLFIIIKEGINELKASI